MSVLNLSPKSIVYVGDQKCEIVKPVSLQEVILKNVATGRLAVESISSLSASKVESAPSPPPPPEEIPEDLWEIANKRFEVIEPLLTRPRTRKEVVARAKERGLDPSTVYEWIRKFECTGLKSSLVPGYRDRGGKGKSRLSDVIRAIIDDVRQKAFEKPEPPTLVEMHQNIAGKCRAAGIKPPHLNTVRSFLREKIKDERARRSKEGREMRKSKEGSFPDGRFPLDVVQIDHTMLDVVAVDEETREPVGRPYITLIIDVFSRMVFGVYVSLDPPQIFSVAQALCIGILPKGDFLRSIGVEGEWEIMGLPCTVHADNAAEFRSEHLKWFCEEYLIHIAWRPVARPQYGAHIERLIGTLNNAVHTLPGTTFSNPKMRGDYDSDQHAAMTVKEIEKWIVDYIVNVYHNTVHSSLGMTPREKYMKGILGDERTPGAGLPRVVADKERLRLSLLPYEKRTIQQYGVNFEGIQYFHDLLRPWINHRDEKTKKRTLFTFRYDPRDISKLFFLDPLTKIYHAVPYRHIKRPPMSLWDAQRAREKAREELKTPRPHEDQIFEALERLQKAKDAARKETKLVRRQKEAEKHRNSKIALTAPKPKSSGEAAAKTSALEDLFANAAAPAGIHVIGSFGVRKGDE